MQSTMKGLGLTVPVGERDHVQGPATAAVTVVEYGDYQCPVCQKAARTIQDLQQRLGNRMRLVFRHFPLREIHPNSQRAAEASEAAAAQGKFWLMHDYLLANQGALEAENIKQYATEIGLDAARFARELDGHTHSTRVREDVMNGTKSGVTETPTFFINGERYFGPVDGPGLAAKVIAAADSTPKG